MLLDEGVDIRGTYDIERFLGQGAFAEVYRVRHRFLGRQAMKVFKRSGMTLAEIEEMLGEAVLLSRIGHPNIVRVFDANVLETPQGLYGYFTMEYVPGGSLDRFWRSHGMRLVPIETTVDIMTQVCRGVALAHAETPPLVHRDIKPQNILVGYESDGLRARLSDFGLAKAVNPLTLLATAAGTFAFKPPEAFGRRKADSCAADVWALGVTLYLLLTDQLPFDVDQDLGWANTKAFEADPLPPSSLNIDVDSSLQNIVLRCIQRDPEDRYSDGRELLAALSAWRMPTCASKATTESAVSSEASKSILGMHSPVDTEEGARLAGLAVKKARQEGRLFEAADMMEEAFNKSPILREQYANHVLLWRRGVSM